MRRSDGCQTPAAGDAERVFDALADGGEVRQPLEETYFSPAFGMGVDRSGTPRMVGTAPAEPR